MNLQTLNAIGSVLSPVAGLVGSGLSFLSGESANSTNLQAVREANAFNERMYERQHKDAMDFWNLQNKYNSPSAEVQRLRAAGLNPALMFGEGAGAASVSLPSASPASVASVQPSFTPAASDLMLKGIQDGIVSSVMSLQAQDQHESMVLDNQVKAATVQTQIAKAIVELQNLIKSGKLSDSQKSYYNEMVGNLQREQKFFDATYNERVDAVSLGNQVMQEQRDNLYSQSLVNLANRQMLAMEPWLRMQQNSRDWSMVNAAVREIDQKIGSMKETDKLTREQIKKVVAETFGEKLKNQGTYYENEHLKGLYPIITRQLQLDLEHGEFNKRFWMSDKMFDYWSGIQQRLQGAGATMMRVMK